MNRHRVAVDVAKKVFQIAECNPVGKVVSRKRLNRREFQHYLQTLNPCQILMEACGTAHYWGRVAQAAGHTVTLLHARYVKPYRRRNKTDRNDCDAMLDAARAVDLKTVPVKTTQQQVIQQLHRLRELWKHNRIQRINCLRGILREHGIEASESTERFVAEAMQLVEHEDLRPIVAQLHILLAEIHHHREWMDQCEAQLSQLLKQDEIVQRIDDISGIGVLTASALVAAVGTPERFKNGRMLSAWLGMTPKEHSSGQRRLLGKISREGNVYIRTLLIHGARSALLAAKRCAARTPEKLTRLQRWAIQCCDRLGHNRAAVALANKLVRISWAVWIHARCFDGNFVPALLAENNVNQEGDFMNA